MSRKYQHVAVLMGGLSSEREISLKSGEASAKALQEEGYRVTKIDVGPDLAARLEDLKPDVCFNALHGKWGEDGCVQGLLEVLGFAYTHSGVLSSALAMHKALAKTVLSKAGIDVAESQLTSRDALRGPHLMAPPYVVKPVAEGSSVGVYIIEDEQSPLPEEFFSSESLADETFMVERYIPGRELTAAVMGDKVLGVIEILPAEGLGFYDFQAKYAPGGSKHVLPAPLSPNIYQLIESISLTAHKALNCRGVTRTDFRYDDCPDGTGEIICLEVNTQPGMTATSLVPELAEYAGWSFGELVRWIVEDGSCNR